VGPVGPVGPVDPVEPVDPLKPAGPTSPAGPIAAFKFTSQSENVPDPVIPSMTTEIVVPLYEDMVPIKYCVALAATKISCAFVYASPVGTPICSGFPITKEPKLKVVVEEVE
jgi:hypothetical protein